MQRRSPPRMVQARTARPLRRRARSARSRWGTAMRMRAMSLRRCRRKRRRKRATASSARRAATRCLSLRPRRTSSRAHDLSPSSSATRPRRRTARRSTRRSLVEPAQVHPRNIVQLPRRSLKRLPLRLSASPRNMRNSLRGWASLRVVSLLFLLPLHRARAVHGRQARLRQGSDNHRPLDPCSQRLASASSTTADGPST